jgi:NAD(P)H dehydrogenase (quinone)
MNILYLYAYPEPRSLNGEIKRFALERLRRAGHDVQLSDLYSMRWKPTVDREDFPQLDPSQDLTVENASYDAFMAGTQSADIEAEQRKLREADALIVQFPMWWFSMPAILKGWFDRVYAYGLAYGVGEHSDQRWGERYGEGSFAGKRAMLIVTMGGWASHYSDRGINGRIQDLLFPIHHGILFYPGFDVLPPYLIYKAKKMYETRLQRIHDELGERLDGLWETNPIPYRRQNAGDYSIPALELKPGISEGRHGLDIHLGDAECPPTSQNESAGSHV